MRQDLEQFRRGHGTRDRRQFGGRRRRDGRAVAGVVQDAGEEGGWRRLQEAGDLDQATRADTLQAVLEVERLPGEIPSAAASSSTVAPRARR